MTKKILTRFSSEASARSLSYMQQYFKPLGVELEVEELNLTEEQMTPKDFIERAKTADCVRMDMALSSSLIQKTPALPELIDFLQVADAFFPVNGRWWPTLLVVDAVKSLIIKRAKALEINDTAYVIGSGPLALSMATIVLGLGYSKLKMVSDSLGESEADIAKLKRYYLGVQIQHVDAAVLTAENSPSSCLMIAQDLQDNPTLLTDISYFNYMKRGGLVIDLNLGQGTSVILEEAARAELKVLGAVDIYSFLNVEFVNRLGLGDKLDMKKFEEGWAEFVKEDKNQTRV